jgi:hypothetical protein
MVFDLIAWLFDMAIRCVAWVFPHDDSGWFEAVAD